MTEIETESDLEENHVIIERDFLDGMYNESCNDEDLYDDIDL